MALNTMYRECVRVGAMVGLLALAACGSADTTTTYEDVSQRLPRPDAVIIEPFAVSPDEVKLDQGLSAELQQALSGGSRTDQERQAGRQVADAIAQKLAAQIHDLGLPAVVGTSAPAGAKTPLFIKGQLVSIDEGNRTERMVIGLGAGRSDVRAMVQAYQGDPRKLVDELQVDAKSGMKPGMAESMGVGALAGHLLTATVVSAGLGVVSESMSDNVVADADRAAGGIAKQLAHFFGQQGWIQE